MSTSMITFRNSYNYYSEISVIYLILVSFNIFLYSEANKKLQDTNDHIQGMVDMPSLGEIMEFI